MKRILRYAVAFLGILFAVYPMLRDIHRLREIRFDPILFATAVLVMLLSYSLLPLIWLYVGRAFGIPLNIREAVNSWFVSSVGRYIPGKVWQFVGRASLLPYPASVVISAMFYEHLILMTGASLFSFVLPRFPLLQVLITLTLATALLMWRYFILLIRRWFPKVHHYPRRWKDVVVAVLLSTLYWAISGFAAYFIAKSTFWGKGYPEIAFVYSFSFVASYVLPLTPAGLGIREAIISGIMGYNLQSSVFALLTRLAILAVDLITLGIGVLAGVRGNRRGDS